MAEISEDAALRAVFFLLPLAFFQRRAPKSGARRFCHGARFF
ncbi:MAG: hypothetical protein ACLUFV_00220 [Acutalibacteraceae bacterium]